MRNARQIFCTSFSIEREISPSHPGRLGYLSLENVLVRPLVLVAQGEHRSVEHAGLDASLCAKLLNAIGYKVVVVDIGEGRGGEFHRKAEAVEPVGYAAVDRNLISGEIERLQQVARLLWPEALERVAYVLCGLDFL